jgi:hypothetical protein
MALKKIVVVISLFISVVNMNAQSFDDEKKSLINYVKRVYNASPFEGPKSIESENGTRFVVTVSYMGLSADSLALKTETARKQAQILAEQGFAEPTVKFEMVEVLQNGNRSTFLFLCETLEQFLSASLRKKSFDGARIISSPNNKYMVSVVALENAKYTTSESRDKVAHMKAKQMVNTLVNGSTITSDVIIRTDENDQATEVTNTEVIREQAMGFIQGLELLSSQEIQPAKTTYIFYTKIQ